MDPLDTNFDNEMEPLAKSIRETFKPFTFTPFSRHT